MDRASDRACRTLNITQWLGACASLRCRPHLACNLLSEAGRAGRSRNSGTRYASTHRFRDAVLRLSSYYGGTQETRSQRQPQSRVAADARRQSALLAEKTRLCDNDRFAAQSARVSELRACNGCHFNQSTVGFGHHIHSARARVHLHGSRHGRLQPPRNRLGTEDAISTRN